MNKQMEIDQLEAVIDLKKEVLKVKEREMDRLELDPDDYESAYEEMLSDVYGDIAVCGTSYDAADLLKLVSPTAYRCGLLDYVDSLDKTETDAYKELEQEAQDLEYAIEDLQSELDELQSEQMEE